MTMKRLPKNFINKNIFRKYFSSAQTKNKHCLIK